MKGSLRFHDRVTLLLRQTGEGQAKMGDWIENGAKLGWLIDPYAKNVHV
jgi:Uma2 family endonuclease